MHTMTGLSLLTMTISRQGHEETGAVLSLIDTWWRHSVAFPNASLVLVIPVIYVGQVWLLRVSRRVVMRLSAMLRLLYPVLTIITAVTSIVSCCLLDAI